MAELEQGATSVTIRPQPREDGTPGPQEIFLASSADIAIIGGAAGGGKTWALLLEALRHVVFDPVPNFFAVAFRRTSPQITRPGGMWDTSQEIFVPAGGEATWGTLTWKWPGGQRVEMHHMQHEKDKLAWKGAQVPLMLFDQLEDFTESQFFYMLSRARSTTGVRPYIRATANPVPPDDETGGWLAKLLAWWWDQETGYAIPERAGVVRFFVRIQNEIHWGATREELAERFGADVEPKSLTFIPAYLDDNPALTRSDPGYRANLKALGLVDQERLLKGNWKIRAEAGKIFNRAWFNVVSVAPGRGRAVRVRYWDKAGTEGGGAESAGVLIAMKPDGRYLIEDVQAGQWGIGERNERITQTAKADAQKYGKLGVRTYVEQEPGSSGKESALITIKDLRGHNVYADRATGDKFERMGPLAAQAFAGNVDVLDAPWTDTFLSILHRTEPGAKIIDQADAAAGAFNKVVLLGRPAPPAQSVSIQGTG